MSEYGGEIVHTEGVGRRPELLLVETLFAKEASMGAAVSGKTARLFGLCRVARRGHEEARQGLKCGLSGNQARYW